MTVREFGEAVGDAVFRRLGRAASRVQERRPLPADLLASDDAYLVVVDAPGAETRDVSVQFDDGTVSVRVDRFRPFHEGFEMRYPGRGLSLHGSVDLPAGASVVPGEATATVTDHGTLRIEIPKGGERIPVEDGAADESVDASDDGDDADGDPAE